MKLLKKLSIATLAAVVTFVAVAQTPTIFNAIRVNGTSDLRGVISNGAGNLVTGDPIRAPGGSEEAPSYSFTDLPLAGLYLDADTVILGNDVGNSGSHLDLGGMGNATTLNSGEGGGGININSAFGLNLNSDNGENVRLSPGTGGFTEIRGPADDVRSLDVTSPQGIIRFFPNISGDGLISFLDEDSVPMAGAITATTLTLDGDVTITGTCTGCVGSGTPGGDPTEVQYNDSGAFGGDPGMTYDEVTDALTVGGVVSSGGLSVNAAGGDVELAVTTDTVAVNGSLTAGTAGGISITPSTGTFTITFDTACTTSPTQEVRYNTVGNIVLLTTTASGDAFNCTSDSTGFADSGTPVPAAIRPTTSVNLPLVSAVDNGAAVYASLLIGSNGAVQVELCSSYSGTGNPCPNPAWTNSGVKGLNNWSASYNINN